MKLLVDTNIILEIILGQAKADEARSLLAKSEEYDFFLSDYALHSIGLLLFRKKQHHIFREFLYDMLIRAGVKVVTLSVEDLDLVVEIAQKFGLDFDDAYQYTIAEKYNLTIVSFDADFDRTERGRKTPWEVLQKS